jgi:putative transposase
MKKSKSLYHGHRFPAGVISCAVRWYFRFQLSLRDIEELLFERGVTVTYRRSDAGATSLARALLTG